LLAEALFSGDLQGKTQGFSTMKGFENVSKTKRTRTRTPATAEATRSRKHCRTEKISDLSSGSRGQIPRTHQAFTAGSLLELA
jgi:hypothetical protein